MELTLRPERHEIIEKLDPVHEWRVARLACLGIPWPVAEAAAGHVDWNHWQTASPRRYRRSSSGGVLDRTVG